MSKSFRTDSLGPSMTTTCPRTTPSSNMTMIQSITAQVTRTWIHDRHIHLLPWAPKSPNMSIIEHVWAYIDKRLEQRYPLPRSVDGLWEVIQEEWYKVPKSLITTLYESMPRRVAMLKMVKGGNTGY